MTRSLESMKFIFSRKKRFHSFAELTREIIFLSISFIYLKASAIIALVKANVKNVSPSGYNNSSYLIYVFLTTLRGMLIS